MGQTCPQTPAALPSSAVLGQGARFGWAWAPDDVSSDERDPLGERSWTWADSHGLEPAVTGLMGVSWTELRPQTQRAGISGGPVSLLSPPLARVLSRASVSPSAGEGGRMGIQPPDPGRVGGN